MARRCHLRALRLSTASPMTSPSRKIFAAQAARQKSASLPLFLLDNAMKYTSPNGSVRITLQSCTVSEGRSLTLRRRPGALRFWRFPTPAQKSPEKSWRKFLTVFTAPINHETARAAASGLDLRSQNPSLKSMAVKFLWKAAADGQPFPPESLSEHDPADSISPATFTDCLLGKKISLCSKTTGSAQ